ncbi:helix-turn-helix transcriptional regulator [Dactylosporangium sp. NPDC000521]|uniref:helix-turn-helix transcriptional regulator n=1 Tax=Dactylosporangium sp. NPDC000521 TaxID=3363975 RepID=UPI0036CCA96F
MRRRALAQRRKDVGLSQERLAEVLRVDRSTVVRWERAETSPQPCYRPGLAEALEVSIEELARLLAADAAVPDVVVPVLRTFPEGDDLKMVRSLRQADSSMGGARLYANVSNYLQYDVAPRMFGLVSDRGRDEVFAVAAGLTEMAGWMAHDAGADAVTGRHFQQALQFATIAHDSQLQAHICGSLSHLSLHLNRPDQALKHSNQGQDRLKAGPSHAGLAAKLFALQARGHAAVGDRAGCLDHLRHAERALGRTAASGSVWVSRFDEASLALEASRCLRRIGQFGAARAAAEQAVVARTSERARSRALSQLELAATLVAQALPEEACEIASDALRSTSALGSAVVMRQLEDIGRRLVPFQPNDGVATFLAMLQSDLRDRRWLARWRPSRNSVGGSPA